MSDTIVVVAPNPAIDLPGYGGGFLASNTGNHFNNGGPGALQVMLSFFNSPNLCVTALDHFDRQL